MRSPLSDMVQRQKQGEPVGLTSVCSAHPLVLEAAVLQARDTGGYVLVEATSNQVDQTGGYTGMRPSDFRDLVHGIAATCGLPLNKVVLGGDHLGPNRWRNLPAEQAMQHAEVLVAAYVAAGFTKIHLDCTFSCADDPTPITDDLAADRAARLIRVAEDTVTSQGLVSELLYVIGTEVPVPGGAHETLEELQPTTPDAARATLLRHHQAITEHGLDDVWPRIMALVVQPGVEFDHLRVVDYQRERTTDLRQASLEAVESRNVWSRILLDWCISEKEIPLRRVMKVTAAMSVAALALAGCGSSTDEKPAAGGSTTTVASGLKVGMAYDVGGRGDQSFNDAAAAGLDKAKAELGIDPKEATAVNGEPESAREERLLQLIDAGYTSVIAVGFAYAPSVKKVAAANPDVKFALIDSTDAAGPNIENLTFAEQEGSFLVGAAAALKSKTGNIGFIGGVNVDLIKKFEAGYTMGAKAVNPAIKVQVKYLTQPPDFSGFGDPAKGKIAAAGMFQQGADVVYAAAGGSGGGVFTAAAAAGKMAIGVDSDQALTAPADVKNVIITSMLKKVDVATFDFIKSMTEKKFVAGTKVYDLKAGGVGYSTTGGQMDDIATKLDDFKQQIIDGKIVVPTKP